MFKDSLGPDMEDNARFLERSQAIAVGAIVASDTDAAVSKENQTVDGQVEMVRSNNKNGDNGCAEHKEPTEEGTHTPEIKITTIDIPRPPKLHELGKRA